MSLYKHFTGTNVALVAVFAGLIAASTVAVPEITLASGVPLSLQTFAVVLAALVLGPWRGAAAVALYLVVGLAGAPIFSNNVGGVAIFGKPSWGYLAGMLAAAVAVGAIVRWQHQRGPLTVATLLGAALVSIPIIYAAGVPVLAGKTGIPVLALPEGCAAASLDWASGCVNGMTAGTLPFLPGDLIKIFLAAGIAAAIHRAYPQILGAANLAVEADSDRNKAAAATV